MKLSSIKLKKTYFVPVTLGLVFFTGLGLSRLGLQSGRWMLLIPVALSVLALTYKNPYHGLLLLIVTLPLQGAFVIEAGFTVRPAYIVLLCMLLAAGFRWLRYKESPLVRTELDLPLAVYAALTIVLYFAVTLVSPPPQATLLDSMRLRAWAFRGTLQWLLFIFFALSFYATVYYCRDRTNLVTARRFFIGVSLVVSCYGIYQFFAVYYGLPFSDVTNCLSSDGHYVWDRNYQTVALFRAHGTFMEPLNLGHYLLSTAPLLLSLHMFRKGDGVRGSLNRHLVPGLIVLFTVYLTQSRGAWIGLLCSLFFIAVFMRGKQWVRFLIFLVLLGIMISLYVLIFRRDQTVFGSIVGRYTTESLGMDPRISYLRYTLKLFSRHPLFGVGKGNYSFYASAHFGHAALGSAHSPFLSVLTETGIAGTAAFCWMLFNYYRSLFRALIRTKHTGERAYFIGYIAGFTGMMVQYLSFGDRFNIYVWVYMGLTLAHARLAEKGEKW